MTNTTAHGTLYETHPDGWTTSYSFHRYNRDGDIHVRIVAQPDYVGASTTTFDAVLWMTFKHLGLAVTLVEGRMLPNELPQRIRERAFELIAQ